MKTFLATVIGNSKKKWCISFECETHEQAEVAFSDIGLEGWVDGELIETQEANITPKYLIN